MLTKIKPPYNDKSINQLVSVIWFDAYLALIFNSVMVYHTHQREGVTQCPQCKTTESIAQISKTDTAISKSRTGTNRTLVISNHLKLLVQSRVGPLVSFKTWSIDVKPSYGTLSLEGQALLGRES